MKKKSNPDGPERQDKADKARAAAEVDKSKSRERVDLVSLLPALSQAPLERVRLGGDETPIVIFTREGVNCDVHYCKETDIGEYVQCNGDGCVLCHIGKKKTGYVLLPVYLPALQDIGVLPVSLSFRPYALFPQLTPILESESPSVAFVSRDGSRYSVSLQELKEGMDGGEVVIKKFMEDYEAKAVDLESVYLRIPNGELAKKLRRLLEY